MDNLVGKVLHDTHRIVRLMGEGGMGAVYEAEHVRLRESRFAVKVLHDKMLGMEEVLSRFQQEAEIATKLGHPNIVYVTDFYETEDGRPCMVMEYLEGEDLSARLKRLGKLSPAALVDLLRQVGSALQAAHAQHIVHRDIKPENIFLVQAPDGGTIAKLLDFGISKIRDNTSVLTRTNALMGTPYYMSPEQAGGDIKAIDHRTDIFALGVIAYRCLSGELPFTAPTPLGIIRQVCDVEPSPLLEKAAHLPAEAGRVVARALAKKRKDRYQQVESFVEDLAAALEDATPEATGDGIATAETGISTPRASTPDQQLAVATADTMAPLSGSSPKTTLSSSVGESLPGAPLPAGSPSAQRNKLFFGVGIVVVTVAASVGLLYALGLQGTDQGRDSATMMPAAEPTLNTVSTPKPPRAIASAPGTASTTTPTEDAGPPPDQSVAVARERDLASAITPTGAARATKSRKKKRPPRAARPVRTAADPKPPALKPAPTPKPAADPKPSLAPRPSPAKAAPFSNELKDRPATKKKAAPFSGEL